MQERESGRLRPEDTSGQRTGRDQYGEYAESGGSSMTTRSGNMPERQQEEGSGRDPGTGWTGYVVPYRYYGPGYRGVGYYSVMYQGAGDGEQAESETQYDQRASRYAEGPGMKSRATAGGGRSGGFAGQGPKGYQRSDERLREEVSDQLMADDYIDASDIEVEVRQGEVTLSGTVRDRWAKRRAEDCAEQVMGVRDVMNQIRVQGSPGESAFRGEGAPGTTTQTRSRAGSTTQRSDSESSRSAETRPTEANGRRKTTSQSR